MRATMAQSHSHAAEAYRILFVIEPSTLAESTAESVTRRLHQTGVANLAYGTATSLAQLESLLPLHAWDLILCHFGHLPSDIADLIALRDASLAEYKADTKLAKSLGPTPETAALTVVANAILNLDAVMMK